MLTNSSQMQKHEYFSCHPFQSICLAMMTHTQLALRWLYHYPLTQSFQNLLKIMTSTTTTKTLISQNIPGVWKRLSSGTTTKTYNYSMQDPPYKAGEENQVDQKLKNIPDNYTGTVCSAWINPQPQNSPSLCLIGYWAQINVPEQNTLISLT